MPDCSEITSKGIFDVRQSRATENITSDVIHWLSVNEFNTQEDAHSAAASFGFVIPEVNIPINSDGSYGDSHKSSWSKAAADYLSQHVQHNQEFESKFRTANPAIVAAWKECVSGAKGLICWAKQTENPNEIVLNVEVRYLTRTPSLLKISKDGITFSDNLIPKNSDFTMNLGVGSPTPYLFVRKPGEEGRSAANFTVITNDPDYRGTAAVPALPPLPPPPLIPLKMVGVWTGTEYNTDGPGYVNMKYILRPDGKIIVFDDPTYNPPGPTTYQLREAVQNDTISFLINVWGGSTPQLCHLTWVDGSIHVKVFKVQENLGIQMEGNFRRSDQII
jgi:hypothetical protein